MRAICQRQAATAASHRSAFFLQPLHILAGHYDCCFFWFETLGPWPLVLRPSTRCDNVVEVLVLEVHESVVTERAPRVLAEITVVSDCKKPGQEGSHARIFVEFSHAPNRQVPGSPEHEAQLFVSSSRLVTSILHLNPLDDSQNTFPAHIVLLQPTSKSN